MADDEGLDQFAPLSAHGIAVGRVVGARPGGNASCDVELLCLSRVDRGYRLRSTVIGLDEMRLVRQRCSDARPPASVPSEDVFFSTLADAISSAGTLIRSSRSEPIAGYEVWLPEDQFLDALTRPQVRSRISWVPQPPRWWNTTRIVLGGIGSLAVFFFPVVPLIVAAELFGWDDVPAIPGSLLFISFFVLAIILRDRSEGLADVIERHLERNRAESGGVDPRSSLKAHSELTIGSAAAQSDDERADPHPQDVSDTLTPQDDRGRGLRRDDRPR